MICEICYKGGNNSTSWGRGDKCGCAAPYIVSSDHPRYKQQQELVAKYHALQEELIAVRRLFLDKCRGFSNNDIDRLIGK